MESGTAFIQAGSPLSNFLDILRPMILDSSLQIHITTSVAGGSLFLMKPVKMRPIAPLIFLPELFLSSVFADEPFPLLRRIS